MPKYIRRTRSSKNSNDQLRDALLRDLEKEGERLLKRMATQFTRDLEKESSRVLQGLMGSGSNSRGTSLGTSLGTAGLEAATSLIGSLVTYAISKPKTSTNTRESERSQGSAADFRLSRSQAMAEATAQLARSDRNY